MFGLYTQFGLSSQYSYNKNWTTPYFINFISNRFNFAVRGPTFLEQQQPLPFHHVVNLFFFIFISNIWEAFEFGFFSPFYKYKVDLFSYTVLFNWFYIIIFFSEKLASTYKLYLNMRLLWKVFWWPWWIPLKLLVFVTFTEVNHRILSTK